MSEALTPWRQASVEEPGAEPEVTGLEGSPALVHTWTADDIARWLKANGLQDCGETFRENRIGGDLLLEIDKEDLAEMGIKAHGDRMRVLKLIEQLRYDSTQVHGSGTGPSTLDFLFLGASPLVVATKEGVKPLELIDLEAEQRAIHKAIIDSNRQCHFKHEFATLRELSIGIFNRSCKVLFLSGHTLTNGRWLLETPGTGEALVYTPQELFQHDETSAVAQEVSQTLPQQSAPSLGSETYAAAAGGVPSGGVGLRLVVLCSCHSSMTAPLFIKAGVPHVIAVERSETVLDVSARVFVQSLCHSLLLGNSVRAAFKHAQWLVRNNECLNTSGRRATAKQEAQKFVLLPEDAEHNAVLFPSLPRGQAIDCSTLRPLVNFPRTRLDLTILRQVELWKVLNALHKHRFVQVLGPPGAGKRTLVCLVAHYLWQRQQFFKDGIHYIHVDDFRWVVAVDWYLRRIIAETGQGIADDESKARFLETTSVSGLGQTTDQLAHESFLAQGLSLPGERLLILDGCHGLYQKCSSNFVVWLSRLLSDNPGLQVLITARSAIKEPLNVEHGCENVVNDLKASIVEVGELSNADAVRLLRWRCHVLPEASPFLEEHGERLVKLCGKLPISLCVCARWLLTQLPREDPKRVLEIMEDEAQRLSVLQPCTVVFDAAVGMLPPFLQEHLRSLSILHSAFSLEVAAAIWGVDQTEAAVHIQTLLDDHLLVKVEERTAIVEAAIMSPEGAPASPTASQPEDGPLYRMQPILRLHLKEQHASKPSDQFIRADLRAKLVACYTGRILNGKLQKEEFPNVQMLLDLTGASSSFLLVLWAVRKNRWVHTWLGDGRRVKLYERALAVLAAMEAQAQPQQQPQQQQQQDGSKESSIATKADAGASAASPCDVFLSCMRIGNPQEEDDEDEGPKFDMNMLEASLRAMLQPYEQTYNAATPWAASKGFLFMLGSPILPAEVWGDAVNDLSTPLLQHLSSMDEIVAETIRKSPATESCSLLDALQSQASRQRLMSEALLGAAISLRSADAPRSLRLAQVAANMIYRKHVQGTKKGHTGSKQSSQGITAKDISADMRQLFMDALVEFALTNLTLCGEAAQSLTARIFQVVVTSALQIAPQGEDTGSLLHLAALHALFIEKKPSQAETLMKRSLELRLAKHNNSWKHQEVVTTLQDCGALCHALGDLAHADSMLRTAASLWQGLDDTKLRTVTVELGTLLTALSRFADAETLYVSSLQMSKDDRPQFRLQVLNHLGRLYLHCDRHEDAERRFRECLQAMEKEEGAESRLSLAAVRHNLAQSLLVRCAKKESQADKKVHRDLLLEAKRLLLRVLDAHSRLLPPTHISTLTAQDHLAKCEDMLRSCEIEPEASHAGGKGACPQQSADLNEARTTDGENDAADAVLPTGSFTDDEQALQEVMQPKSIKEEGAESLVVMNPVSEEVAEPQTEPVAASDQTPVEQQRVRSGVFLPGSAGDDFGLTDLDQQSLTVFQRVACLYGDRAKANLGIVPPFSLSCREASGEGADVSGKESGKAAPPSATTPTSLPTLISQMELECKRWCPTSVVAA